MKKFLLAISAMFIPQLYQANVFAQNAVYSEAFVASTPATTQCNTFTTFRASLNPGIYTSVTISGTFDPVGITCTDPVIVNDLAAAMLNNTTYMSPASGGNVWHYCNRGTYQEVWLNPPASCSGSNCPNPGYLIRPCIGTSNSNWGGVNTATCTTNPSQTMTITFVASVPCSTHLNQAIVVGPDEVCPNKNFTLKVGIASGLGMSETSVQWEVSQDGVTWAPFTGTVSPTGVLTDAISTPKWYRAKILCTSTGQSFTTPGKYITIAPFYYCYCDNSRATAAAGAADIGNVTVDEFPGGQVLMNNGAGLPTYTNPASNKVYTDFRKDPSTPPIPIYADSAYRLYVRQINAAATMAGTTALAWLDFNRNGTFDPWEQILQKSPSATPLVPGQVFDTFSVEADSFRYGLTGLRVVLRSGAIANPADPCASYPDGETEDYLIDMRYTPCTGKPTAGRVESDTSMCIGYGYVVTDTSYQKYVHGIETSWEESGDGVAWFPVPNSANKDTLMRVFMGQPVYYRMLVKCTHSGDSSYTDPFRVNVKPTYKCYCHSQSMGGAADTSDIGAYNIGIFNTNDGGGHLGNPRAVKQRQDWTDLPEIEMYVDSLYQFFVYHTMPNKVHADAKITVFVDFNNNKKYDIPAERIYTGFTSSGNFTRLGKVPIPADVITDVPTGMRVVLNNEVAPNIPSDEGCGEYVSGETEDYIVRFTRRLFPASVNEIDGMGSISLYPNPTSGKFTLAYSGASGEVKVRITTVTGQILQERVIENKGASMSQEFDLGGQASGVYFIEVEANGQKTNHRILLK